jgi:hypothetical protein
MGNLVIRLTYPAEDNPLAHIPSVSFLLEEDDMIHHVPAESAQATGIPSEGHRLGMTVDGGFGGKVVTQVGTDTDTPGSRSLGFL